MSEIKTAGSMNLIFDEQEAAILDKYSVDFGDVNIAIAFDEARGYPCVSIGDRETGNMRYYDIVDGRPLLATTDEGYCEPIKKGKDD